MAGSEKSRGAEAQRKAESTRTLGFPMNSLGRGGRERFRTFVLIALTWFAIISIRLLDLQVLRFGDLTQKAIRQQEATVDIIAKRGAIFDRHGNELALSTPAQSIGVFSDRAADKAALARLLTEALAVDEADLFGRLQRGGFQWVKRLATLAETERARSLGLDILHFETESKRYYPHGTVAAHVLGTVGLDHHGQAGLEQQFETRLRGESGLGVLHYDARQRRYGTQILETSLPGDDLILHLDLDIQSLVQLELERAVKESRSQAGTVVLMRPDSGEVVAMASWPRFDPNNLSRTPEDLENLRNFAVSYLVEPGSTFKVLTAAAALEEGVVTTEDVFDCEMGEIWIKRRRIRDHHPYGLLSMPEVLMKSSNVGIIKIGYRLGDRRLHKYIRQFGFGQATGIGLPGEVHGLVRRLSDWSGSSLASLSMGQEIGVSALQMARLFGVIANGGTLVEPRIVRAIRELGGSEVELDQASGPRVLSADTAATMQAILERVVEAGTGRLAQIPGYRVAGKTGTAQMINPVSRSYADGAYLASFCGFAPVNDPALVGVAMLYDPRGQFYYGGRIAAPLFSSVMKKALRQMDVAPSYVAPQELRPVPPVPDSLLADFVGGRPDDDSESDFLALAETSRPESVGANFSLPRALQRPAAPESEPVVSADQEVNRRVAPDMRGLTMREAFSLAARLGIEIEPTGSGMAQTQFPEPDEALLEGQVLQLHFGLSRIDPRGSGSSAVGGGG